METVKEKKSGKGCLIIALVALAIIVCGGWIISNQMIKAQKASCAVIEAGIGQLSGQTQESEPQTEEACLQAVEAARPFLRFWGFGFAGIGLVGLVMTSFALIMIFGPKKKPTEEPAETTS